MAMVPLSRLQEARLQGQPVAQTTMTDGGDSGEDWFAQQGAPGGGPEANPAFAQSTLGQQYLQAQQGAPPSGTIDNYGGGAAGAYHPPGPDIPLPPGAAGGTSGGADPRIAQFIAQWQQTHSPSEGIGPLAAAIQQQFPDVSRYMYGATPSGNELNIGGEKYKVLGGEGGPAAYWYAPGMNDLPGGGGGGFGGYGSSAGPRPYGTSAAPQAPTFELPQLNEATDPGYAARLKMGTDALERSAAARGTLLTGGTLKGLNRFAQDFASNEYGNVYTRALGAHQTNYQNAYNTWQGNLGAQNQGYNQLYNFANLGASAAAGTGAANTGYGNAGSGLLTDIGNARAGGTLAQNQAWQNPVNQATNAAQMYYLSKLYGGGGGGGTVTPPYAGYGVWQ